MRIVDANVLLYAVNEDSAHHEVSRGWLDEALAGDEGVGLPWLTLVAFTRLATHPAIFPRPLTADAAFDRVQAWLGAPAIFECTPGPRHVDVWRGLIAEAGSVGGNLINDAHLGALAVEHRATLITFDTDFARFSGVSWHRPGE